mgnify:CR=1 FL=1
MKNKKWMSWEEVVNLRILKRETMIKIFEENGLTWLLKFLENENKTEQKV